MNKKWDAEEYKKNFNFVYEYGNDIIDMIQSPKGSFVVDVGCGNGELTAKLAQRGYEVLGVDASLDMLNQMKKNHPNLPCIHADATSFTLERKADVIFSNAVFHWISDQERLIRNLYFNLIEGGELVFEFGGFGCAEQIHSTLETIFQERGLSYPRTFYFPKIGEYSTLLEKEGFTVKYAILFDRPTKQNGKDGLKNWIRMFNTFPFSKMDEKEMEEILCIAEDRLKDKLYQNGIWIVDYVRIRMRAIK